MKESYFNQRGLYYKTNTFLPNRLTLVFVHGLSGSSSAWLPYEKIFENKYNILTFDIRGHGKSKKFSNYEDYEIKKFAEDIHDLVSYLNISKFVLISHSFATLIALEYIKLYGESVLANILFSPIVDLNQNFLSSILRPILDVFRIFNFLPFNPKPGHHVDYSKYPNSTDWDLARCYADVTNTTLRVYLYSLRQSLNLEQEYALEQINAPTLIVHGVEDTMAPVKNSVALSKKIKNSELIVIPNTDHIVVLNNIREISEIIESFLEKNQNFIKFM